jgi:hypothetical protein
MIWFACKNCGKRHKQSADAAGSLVFCACGQANRVPWESTVPAPRERAEDESPPSSPRRRRQPRRRDPAYCLNHDEASSVHTCPDCGEAFCPRCLVELQGLRLCGPCKNFRVRQLQRSLPVAGLAVAALVAGLLSAPVIFCMTIVPATQAAEPGVVLGVAVVGMVIGTAALVLGLFGLREAERQGPRGGRGLAMTGAALGTAGLLWSLSLVVVVAGRLIQG